MAPPFPDMPNDPIVRFRLRTLLMATTALAVIAAIAGPIYRAAAADGRRNLLLFWSAIITFSAISYFLRLREPLNRRANHSVRFVVYSHTGKIARGRYASGIVWLAAIIAGIIWMTYAFGFVGLPSQRHVIFHPLYWGFLLGSGLAGYIVRFVRQPLYLCDGGIPLAKGYLAPWKYIRSAEWLSAQASAMKLRRYDGDIYIEVPPAIRDDVEAFIREKIGADIVTSAKVSPRSLTGG